METVPGRSLKTQSLACGALWKTGSWVHTQAVGSRLCGHSLVLFLVLSSASWCTEKWGALVSHWHCHKLGGVNWNWVPINLSFATLCLSVFCTVMRKDTAAQESGLEETIPFSLSQRLEWESSTHTPCQRTRTRVLFKCLSAGDSLSLGALAIVELMRDFFSFTFKKRFFLWPRKELSLFLFNDFLMLIDLASLCSEPHPKASGLALPWS